MTAAGGVFIDDPNKPDGSEPGSYATAFLYPPFAGAMEADGTFRRGFPAASDVGCRRQDAGGLSAPVRSFHATGDRRVGQ